MKDISTINQPFTLYKTEFKHDELQDDDLYNDVPPEFICPITLCIMKHPVIMPDGQTYEKEAIQKALGIKAVSPVTQQPMEIDQGITNYALKSLIEKYVQEKKAESIRNHSTITQNGNKLCSKYVTYAKAFLCSFFYQILRAIKYLFESIFNIFSDFFSAIKEIILFVIHCISIIVVFVFDCVIKPFTFSICSPFIIVIYVIKIALLGILDMIELVLYVIVD